MIEAREVCVMAEKRHPGISMHKLPVSGGAMGMLFAVGSAVIFVLGFPTLWYFVAFSAGLGVAIAWMIRFIHERRSDRRGPLSILTVSEESGRSSRPHRRRGHRVFRILPTTSGA